MNKKQYKNNRGYKAGYDDGNKDGFKKGLRKTKSELDKKSKELADIQNELVKERRINTHIKSDADKARVDADKARADADKQSGRLDKLQERCDKYENDLSELYEQQSSLETEINNIDEDTFELDRENRSIQKEINALENNDFSILIDKESIINEGKIKFNVNCEKISHNNTRRHSLNDELRGLNIRINSTKADYFDLLKDDVKMA